MVVQTKEQIFLLLHQSQEKLKKFGVKRCGLFGSFLHERQNLQSDIDLLVEFETDKKTYDNYIHLAFFLEELFGRPVDSHAIGTNPRLQAGKTSVLARVKMPAGSNIGPP